MWARARVWCEEKNSRLFKDHWKVNCPYCKFSPLRLLFFVPLRVQRLCNFRSFSAWNATRDVSGRKVKEPAASSCRKFLRRVKGREKKRRESPVEKFRQLPENSAGTAREEWTSSPSFFSFSSQHFRLRVFVTAKESLRASSSTRADIYIASSLSLLPSIAVLKHFTFAHLKAEARSWVSRAGVSPRNVVITLALRRIGWWPIFTLYINALSRENI